jgi:peptide/nickel transport system substrate-binding protein
MTGWWRAVAGRCGPGTIPDEFPTLAAPWGYQAQTALVLRNIHEPLLDRDPATGNLIPGLATSWEQIDELTWRFHLREGVTFHDGSPFNAKAAAYAINDTYAPENCAFRRNVIIESGGT